MMDRDRFESALGDLISAHDRKVCAEIDAGACRTARDFDKMHRARDAYAEAHDAFLDEVFAPPPPPLAPPPPVTIVVGHEERDRRRTRGRPLCWRRWLEIRIVWRSVTYTFTADVDSLTLDSSTVEAGDSSELQASDFDPLCAGHSIRFRGLDYSTTEPGPAEVVKIAVEACRTVALRLHAHGVDHFAATRVWPRDAPRFDELVKGEMKGERGLKRPRPAGGEQRVSPHPLSSV